MLEELEQIDNEIFNSSITAVLALGLTAFAKYQLDKLAVHYGITVDPNIRDIVEPTTWPTGVINPKTGNEFKEFRIRRIKRDVKLENVIGDNRFFKKHIHKAFKYAKKLPGESELKFQWRRAQHLLTSEVMPVGNNFILLLNLAHVVPKASFRVFMDKFESTYRANMGALFDDDKLQALGVDKRDYRDEDYALPLLILDPTNEEMRIIMLADTILADPDYFPDPEDCVVRLPRGRKLPEHAQVEDGISFSTANGTFYRAPHVDRFRKQFQKAGVFKEILKTIGQNEELYNFMIAMPTDRILKIDAPSAQGEAPAVDVS